MHYSQRWEIEHSLIVAATLGVHWLAGIDCDEERKMDRARCACSALDLGWQVSVGAARDTWIEHVLNIIERHTGGKMGTFDFDFSQERNFKIGRFDWPTGVAPIEGRDLGWCPVYLNGEQVAARGRLLREGVAEFETDSPSLYEVLMHESVTQIALGGELVTA